MFDSMLVVVERFGLAGAGCLVLLPALCCFSPAL